MGPMITESQGKHLLVMTLSSCVLSFPEDDLTLRDSPFRCLHAEIKHCLFGLKGSIKLRAQSRPFVTDKISFFRIDTLTTHLPSIGSRCQGAPEGIPGSAAGLTVSHTFIFNSHQDM